MQSNKQLLGEFLDVLWGKGTKPRRIGLAYKPKPNQFDVLPMQDWPAKRNSVLEFILGASAKGQTPYIPPAMLKPDATSLDKDNVLASWVLWVDFDGNADEARARLAAGRLPVPSWRLQTGLPGHEHWYWVLNAPAAPEQFEQVNKKLAYFLDGDTGCWNMNRVMRPPYTKNYMDAKKYAGQNHEPQPIDFLEQNDNRYDLSDFDMLPSVNTSLREDFSELGDIPSIADVLAKYDWDELHLGIFKEPPTGKGGRSDVMVRLAYFGAEVGMPDEAIYAVISDVDNRVGKFVGRRDRERRLAEIIAKARVKYPYASTVKFTQTNENIKMVFTFDELLDSDFQIEWLIQDLLVARTSNFLTAMSGTGKSRMAMQLARAMATGSQFIKWPIERKIKVMYLSLEMQGDMLKHFASSLTHGKKLGEDSGNFILVPLGKALDLAKPESYDYIEMLIKEYKPEVLMVDAVGKLTPGDLDGPEAKNINNQLNALIADHGITFFLIHHNRKGDNKQTGKRPGLEDVYGNQYILTDASTCIILWDPEQNQAHVEMIFAKTRASTKMDPVILNGRKDFSFMIKEKDEDEPVTDDSDTGYFAY